MTFGKVKLKFSSIIKVQCRPNICFFFHLLLSAKKKVWHHDKSSNYGSWNHRVFMFLLRSLALGSEGCAALFYTSHAQCNKVESVVEFKLRSSKLFFVCFKGRIAFLPDELNPFVECPEISKLMLDSSD